MNKKQVIILSVILGILVLGVLLKSWVRSRDAFVEPAQRAGISLDEFDPAEVERVLIRRPVKQAGRGSKASSIELAKENGTWNVKSLWSVKAVPAKVEDLIQKLRSPRGELRGSGKKIFRDFGIEDADSFSIKFLGTGDAPLLDLRLGTKRAGPDGYFMRKASSEDVYLVTLDLAALLGIYEDLEEAEPASGFWADLSLFNLDPEKVAKITIYHLKGDEKTMVLGLMRETDPKDPAKSSWKFMRKDMKLPPDPDKILKFIAILGSVKAQKAVDPDGQGYGLEKPVWQMAVTADNQKTLLNAGPKDAKEDLYYVKTSAGPSVFSLSGSFFSDLNVDDTHFVKESPAAAAPSKNLSSGSEGQVL